MKTSFSLRGKALAFFVAAVLLVTSLAIAPVSAAQLKDDQTFGHISEYKAFYDEYKDAVDKVANGLFNLETRIDVSEYGVPLDDIKTLYTTVVHTHPELFYVSGSYSYSYYQQNGQQYVYSVNAHWGKLLYDDNGNYLGEETYTNEQVLQMRAEFRERAQWYLDKVDENMSDFEKALILHDELALNSSYLLSGETYDFMVHGQGKCYGYSEAYSYLLAQVGVNSEIVESTKMFHQWNKVEIDGVYYHVDVTWDDPVSDKPGFVQHTYFLLSDEEIEGLTRPHYDYSTDFPTTDTRYDGMGFHKINTQLCYVGNDCYVVDNNHPGKSDTAKNLLIYDISTDTFQTVESFQNEYWSAGNGYVWQNMYMSLQERYEYLYMNTENTVYVYDTRAGELKAFAENTFEQAFYGLRVIDDKVYVVLSDNPNNTGTLQYVGDCLLREPEPTTEEPTTEEPTTEEPATEEPTTEPAPQDTYIVAGNPADIFGTAWDANNELNLMAQNGDVYTKTYTVDKAYKDVQFKVVKNGTEWFGDETGNNVTFNLTAAGDFTVTFDPATLIPSVTGENVAFPSEFGPGYPVFVAGNGEGAWLNGASWDPAYLGNEMNSVADNIWEITFENVTDGFERQVKFAVDGAWTHNFGGTFVESGVETDAVYNGNNISFDTEDDSQTVKIQLDLRNFDFTTKTGAKFTITIIPDIPESVLGDLDGDGEVTVTDATDIQQYLSEFTELTEEQLAIADVNRDGKVNVKDVTEIQRYIAELIHEF